MRRCDIPSRWVKTVWSHALKICPCRQNMFNSVSKKLRMAEYFIANLKNLADDAGGFAYISSSKRVEADANLDGFFFEIISAKEFFLQELNNKYNLHLKIKDVKEDKLLASDMPQDAKRQVERIKNLLSDPDTWLWRINHYRNTAAHHRLFQRGFVATSGDKQVRVYLFKDPDEPEKGNSNIEVIPYCEQSLKKVANFLEDIYSKL